MKTPLITLCLISGAFVFNACDLLDSADDVNFDATVDETVVISESSEGTFVDYTEVITLDAKADPDVNKYKDKISGFTIKKVTYQVISYSGTAGATFSGTLAFGDTGQTTPTVAAVVNNLDLPAAYTSGQEFNLVINPTDISKIEALLKDDKAVKLYLNGTLSSTPANANILVTLDVSVKADAL